MQSLKGCPIIVRSAGKLGDDLVAGKNSTGQRFASIPAFTAPPEDERSHCWQAGMVKRQCTSEYKIEVVERTIRYDIVGLKPRQWMPKDVRVFQYFGISLDEQRRAEKAKKRFAKLRWAEPVYPLISMGWSRTDCVRWLADKVPHEVPRSACVFCPFHSDAEWAALKTNDRPSWDRAVQVDRSLRAGARASEGMRNELFLHRKCIPLEMVDFPTVPNKFEMMKHNECEGMCGL